MTTGPPCEPPARPKPWSDGGDPTANVISLSEAATKRQDDLRELYDKYTQARIDHVTEVSKINYEHNAVLTMAESRRVDEQAALRAMYSERLAEAESKRIDAIRLVDVNAVLVAANRASDQASVLATNVASSAEALRTLVATTATAFNANLQQMFVPVGTRLAALEQAQYQSVGKQSYSDPAFVDLSAKVNQLTEISRQGMGKSEGINSSWLVILGVVTLLSLGLAAFVAFNHPAPAAPQVVYLPAPPVAAPLTTRP